MLPGPLPAGATSRRSPSELLARRRLRPRVLAPGPSVHPFARSMAHTDVRLTTRWEEDDLAMAFYSCLHEFGHGLYEAQMDPRHYRTTLAEATGLGVHESQSRLWENLVGRSKPFCEYVLPLLRKHLDGPFEAIEVPELYRNVNQVRLSPDPDRGGRDDVQPAHRAALRARARAGRGPARRQGPARGVERGDPPPARPRDAVAQGGRPAGHPLGHGDDRLLPDLHDREPDGRPAVARARPTTCRRSTRASPPATSPRCASGCATTSTATAASSPRASCSSGSRARSCGWSRSSPTSRASCWTPGC